MGFFDAIFGESPSIDYAQSPNQKGMGDFLGPWIRSFLGGAGPTAQDILPTQANFQSLAPQLYEGLMHPINMGANQLSEQLMGSGIMGGSAGSALGKYYGEAMPRVGGQVAGMLSGALQYPYQYQMQKAGLAGGLMPSTYANPVVNPGSQGMLGGLMSMAAPFAMSHLPWGNFGGNFGGGGGGNWNSLWDPFPF